MKKTSINGFRRPNARQMGSPRTNKFEQIEVDQSPGNLVNLDALDNETRRAVQIVLYRMPQEGRRALIHAANVEAFMDLPAGYLINPWAVPFFEENQNRADGRLAFLDLVGASTNSHIRPTSRRLLTLLGAIRTWRT